MEELKPCPFCGGKPYLETRHRAFIKAQTTRVAFVRCTECNARTNRFELQSFGCTRSSKEANTKAIEAWNRRIYNVHPRICMRHLGNHRCGNPVADWICHCAQEKVKLI